MFGGGNRVVQALGFWLPPIMAAITVLLIWRVGTRLAGRWGGLVVATILAILPGHIIYTFVSELDHHPAEPLLCLALLGSLLTWGREGAQPPRFLPGWLRLAGWLVISILIWRGSVIFWGTVWGAIALQLAGDVFCGRSPQRLARFGLRAFRTADRGHEFWLGDPRPLLSGRTLAVSGD